MLNIAHISDPHTSPALTSASTLVSGLGADLNVCSGDICSAWFEQGIGSYDNNIFAPIIGNHDAILKAGAIDTGYDWTIQPTQQQLYNRYFYGCKLVNAVNGYSWWSWENSAENVLILGINNAIYDSATLDTENAWLKEKLAYAAEKGLAVMIFQHGLEKSYNAVSCNFTNRARVSTFADEAAAWLKTYPYSYKLSDTIKAFSGKLLGIFAGHTHYDIFATVTTDNGENVPYIAIGSLLHDSYNDVARSDTVNTLANAVLNLYRYSANLNALEVYRLGASGSASGDRRKMLVWDYGKQAIVSQVSATEY